MTTTVPDIDAEQAREIVVGIDTHAETHHVAVIDMVGRKLADAGFSTTLAGYLDLTAFVSSFGVVRVVGVEGTHSYGAGITRHLQEAGLSVVEVLRPARQLRRMRGKSDPIDAYAAAATALANIDEATQLLPKTLDGDVEAVRYLHAARRSAVKARAAAHVQIKSLLVTAPEPIRAHYRTLPDAVLIESLAGLEPADSEERLVRSVKLALRSLARRYQVLSDEIARLEDELAGVLDQVTPALVRTKGIGTITAAQLLITAGENSHRLHSEAAFAALCGASPIPASSGKTNRHRLNRGGDRQANAALHHIALCRISVDARTRAYVERKRHEGKGNKEILRCLKRAIAREVYKVITNPSPIADYRTLRPMRQQLGFTQVHVAKQLNINPAKVSLIERGLADDNDCVIKYAAWLQQQI